MSEVMVRGIAMRFAPHELAPCDRETIMSDTLARVQT